MYIWCLCSKVCEWPVCGESRSMESPVNTVWEWEFDGAVVELLGSNTTGCLGSYDLDLDNLDAASTGTMAGTHITV